MNKFERLGLKQDAEPNRKKGKEKSSNILNGEGSKENSPNDLSRRDFLKTAGKTAAGAAVAGAGGFSLKKLGEIMGEESSEPEKPISTPQKEPEPTPEQKEIVEENIKSIKEIIDFNKEGEIELNLETAEALKNYWKERHTQNTELKDSLIEAYEEMSPWDKYLKEEFNKADVPEKFRYMLIPESYFDTEAVSPAGAVGPYQFMPDTGRSYGLESKHYGDCHPNVEERQDPIKSARACAELIRDLYDKGGEDWDLALSGYNGTYYWKYLKQTRRENTKKSYEGFLKFLEKKINKIKEEKHEKINEYEKMLDSEHISYSVKKGDGLRKIAMRFRTDVEKLQKINQIEDPNRIRIGQEIKIPVKPEKQEEIKKKVREEMEKEFWSEVRGFSENLNYPPKFNAVFELIEEGFVNGEAEPLEYETYTIPGSGDSEPYIFKKGDSVRSLAQRKGVSVEDIMEANGPDFNPNSLNEGDKIIIPSQNPTLLDIAKENNKSLEELTKLNPAIVDPKEEIPAGYEIRV